MIVVLILPSATGTGVKRWIGVGSFNIQPSEIMKFAIIIFLAHWGAYQHKRVQTFKYGALPPLVILELRLCSCTLSLTIPV